MSGHPGIRHGGGRANDREGIRAGVLPPQNPIHPAITSVQKHEAESDALAMREKNKSWLREAWDELRATCGFPKSRSERLAQPRTRQVEVHIQLTGGDRTVGFLSIEGSQFVFRYDSEYAKDRPAEPISAFPDLTREYRSDQLWPFFESRLPP